MRYGLVMVALAFAAGLLYLSDDAQASTQCHASGNWCQGYAWVGTQTGGTASERCFSLRATNAAPTCTLSGLSVVNDATWENNAGLCIDLYYFDTTTGAVPPAAPNKVTVKVMFDTSTTNTIRTFQLNGAEPASGTKFTFCFTNDGTSTGTPRAGTYRLYLNLVKDDGNGLPGNTNYNIDTDGVATVGTIPGGHFDKGALRGRQFVSALSRSAYPSGTTFAYGAAGDEAATITGVFTQPNGDGNVECMNTGVLDDATQAVGALGAVVDVDAVTSLAQPHTVDTTFPVANSPYRAILETGKCNAALTALPWTWFAASGHGAGLVRDSNTLIHATSTFNIDPRIVPDSDGAGTYATADNIWLTKLGSSSGLATTNFNRGETAYGEGYVLNARGEQLTRSMTFSVEDASANVCQTGASLTPTSGKYSTTWAIPTGGSCAAAATDPGSPRYLRITNTDQNALGASFYTVSTLLRPEVHLDSATPRTGTEVLEFFVREAPGGGDASDTVHLSCFVGSVRGDAYDTSGSAVSWAIVDPLGSTRASGTTDTASDGWTATDLDFLASTPLGSTWEGRCPVSHNGNTGTDTDTFTITLPEGGGDTFTGDPLKIFGGDSAIAGETVRLAISEAYLDGTARTGNAAGTFVRILTPSNTLEVSDATPTEVSHGVYRYDWTPATTGPYLILARTTDPDTGDPIGTSNIVYVRSAAAMTPGDNDTVENSTLALLLDKLGPQGEPVNIESATADFWIPILFWIAVLLFTTYYGWLVMAGFAVPGLLAAIIPDLATILDGLGLDFSALMALCVLGFLMELAANRFSWGGYTSGSRRLKTPGT